MKTQQHINDALTRQLKRLKQRRDALEKRGDQLANLRVLALFGGGLLTIIAFFADRSILFGLSLLVTITVFSMAVRVTSPRGIKHEENRPVA